MKTVMYAVLIAVAIFLVASLTSRRQSISFAPTALAAVPDAADVIIFPDGVVRVFEMKSLLQLQIAVLQNGRKDTERIVFCQPKFEYDLQNWEIDPQIERLRDHELMNYTAAIRLYGKAKNCWNGPPWLLEEVLGRGEHILAIFDPLRIVDLNGFIGIGTSRMAFEVR